MKLAVLTALVLAAIATVQPYRLIGFGCTGAPLGLPQLAREESDWSAPCERIEPLPWKWQVIR